MASMNNIKISSFKAFKDDIEIALPNGKNLLLYGENGSGKSSLYMAFKIIFFKDKMLSEINTASTPEEQEQINSDFWNSYNNKISLSNFLIKVNEIDYNSFDTNNYQPFLITLENLYIGDKIKLTELLERFDLSIDNLTEFCETNYIFIQDKVNETLGKIDKHIQIEIDREVDYEIRILDNQRNIASTNDIRRYFNEAKINLIILLIVFSSIKQYVGSSNKKKILVLDDFITSLDAANRIILAKYVLESFSEYQLFLFTHNASFFNLIYFLIHDYHKNESKWAFANLYEINTKNKLYQKEARITAKKLIEEFEDIVDNDPAKIELLGNRIRQKFETMLYELSKLLLLGTLDESNAIIERIGNSQALYYKKDKSIYDLIDEINGLLTPTSTNKSAKIKSKISAKIQEYKVAEFDNIKYIVKELTLYRKITLHPMSHAAMGLTTFTVKELEHSLFLIQKLETALKAVVNKNVSTI